jgi:hypothetical protein
VQCVVQSSSRYCNHTISVVEIITMESSPVEQLFESRIQCGEAARCVEIIKKSLIPFCFDIGERSELFLNFERFLPRLCSLVTHKLNTGSNINMSLVGEVGRDLGISIGQR